MVSTLITATFALGLAFYGAASIWFFMSVARIRRAKLRESFTTEAGQTSPQRAPSIRLAPWLLAAGGASHFVYIYLASMVAQVCPVHSVHFILSVTSLLAIGAYLIARRYYRIDALGMVVTPLALAFLLGTFFLAGPSPQSSVSPLFLTLHVFLNLVGTALFVLAGAAAILYLIQEKRLKQKRPTQLHSGLPALDTLDRAEHRFLIAGFPLLTIGIITGTFWAHQLEFGSFEEVMRIVFGYTTWLLIAAVLLLRAAAGWRGRRAAYGTIAVLSCAMVVILIYLVRPAAAAAGG